MRLLTQAPAWRLGALVGAPGARRSALAAVLTSGLCGALSAGLSAHAAPAADANPGARPTAAAPPASAASAPATASAAAPARLQVSGFRVRGNTLLPPDRIERALAPWTGARTLAELRRAAEAVQALYGAAGYGAVVAYLPPQPVQDGVLTIAVLEGRLARVTLQGQQRIAAQRVRAALPTLAEGRTPYLARLDRELQLANENPSRRYGVLLGPGAAPGAVDATIKVEEKPLQRWSLALDNSGNERSGHWRASLGWQHADLSGHDDVLGLQLQTSPTDTDKVQVGSLGYRLPLVRLLAAVDLFAAYSSVDGDERPVSVGSSSLISFSGKGRVYGLRYTTLLPRLAEYDQRLALGLDYRAYLNACRIGGFDCLGAASASVVVHPLTLEYTLQRGGAYSLGLSAALTRNLALGGRHGSQADFDAARSGAPRAYTVARLGASAALPVLEDWLLSGRLALQLSGDRLVSGEQFGLGGAASVRGFQERELSADQGGLLSVELTTPRWQLVSGEHAPELRALAFADWGLVHNRGDLECRSGDTRCDLAAVGLGLRLDWRAAVARLSLAQALADGQGERGTQRGDWNLLAQLLLNY